jgi:putative transposase
MITFLSALVSLLSFRVRSRACLELELIALRHQVSVVRRQHPGQLRLFSTDRLLWVLLYRIWPQVLNAMVLVNTCRGDLKSSPRPGVASYTTT